MPKSNPKVRRVKDDKMTRLLDLTGIKAMLLSDLFIIDGLIKDLTLSPKPPKKTE